MEPCLTQARRGIGWPCACAATCLVLLTGCAFSRPRGTWTPPKPLTAADDEPRYAAALELDANDDPRCIDEYLAVAQASWSAHVAAAGQPATRGSELYASALRQALTAACRLRRWQPQLGLVDSQGVVTPAAYAGFAHPPDDFHDLHPVGEYTTDLLESRYVQSGIGVPLVALPARAGPFQRVVQPFAATAVLSPVATPAGAEWRLVLYDPLRVSSAAAQRGQPLPLAGDATAPLAYQAATQRQRWLSAFLRPAVAGQADGLSMIEPYQPGKIPVILVHGLLSDSFTWTALGNELRVHPELRQRYQFWTYSYASGEPFLTSAAVLREELARVRATYDPERCDPALGRIVLVGHSMGGLIAKLQATHSGDALWASSATRPLESLNAPPYVHRQLRRGFYFTPSPDVARIVFIGTPHRGSAWASRTVGQVGAALVAEPPERKASFAQLVRDNPDVFRGDLQQRIPTSVDLLEPTSALLQAMNELPYRSGVPLHTILGSGRWTLGEGPSDGVVAVDSARLEGVQSELVVDASHEELPRHEAVMAEVVRILRRHAR